MVLKIHVLGTDYDRLTMVMETRHRNGIPCFLIDYPEGFREALSGTGSQKVRFDFTGLDRIPHLFRAPVEEIAGDQVWVGFPDVIERVQRRRHFRLKAPVGTRLHLPLGDTRDEIIVADISQGGLLASPGKEIPVSSIPTKGQSLKDLILTCPFEGTVSARIKEAQVRGLEKDPLTGRYNLRLRFTDLDMDEKMRLKGLIYKLQRHLLRKM